MRIGITFDLRERYIKEGYGIEETAEFDKLETIESIGSVLVKGGHSVEFIGTARDLAEKLVKGERWDMVFNIAEGLHGVGREAQVPAMLDVFNIPYTFSDPMVLSLTLHKGMAKRVIRDLGIPTPDFFLIDEPEYFDFSHISLPFPLFVKPVAEGTGKGIDGRSITRTPQELRESASIIFRKFRTPIIVEQYLPGREFTVGILGTGETSSSLGVMEVIIRKSGGGEVYSYQNKEEFNERVEYRLATGSIAQKASNMALAAWRGIGGKDGGRVDLREDSNGCLQFLEVNSLPGLNPKSSDLPILCRLSGIPYDELILGILESTQERMRARVNHKAVDLKRKHENSCYTR